LIDHPTPAELEAFVWDRGPAGGDRKIMVHLIHCKVCLAAVAPHLRAILGQGEPPPRVLSPQEDAAYDRALDRAFSETVQQAQQLREERKREAIALFANADPDALPEIPDHLRGIPAIEGLLELSSSLRHEDPERMVRFAELACFFAQKVPLPELDTAHLADFQCKVLIELGNAYRVADNLDEAQYALGNATVLLLDGTQNKLLYARLMDVQASLFGALRRFDMAGSALDFVFTVHSRRGDQHKAGRALISRGVYTGYQGDAEGAVHLLQQGFDLIDKDRDPGLVFLALHNQARFLMDCGRLKDALKMIFEIRSRHLDPGGRINELKVRWVEGQIYAALGYLDRARRALQSVKEGFAEIKLPYKAALASLELAAVLLRQGDREGSRAEVLPAAEVFLALKIQREALATVLLLKERAQRDQVDAVLLDYVIRLLRREEETAGEE
jgi:tetratricopeptide (TPR) repeat protein